MKTKIEFERVGGIFRIYDRFEPKTIIAEFENDVNHFEYDEDNADIFDTATKVPVYGQAYGAVRDIAGAAGKLFGVGTEDKSTVGFDTFRQNQIPLPFYPTKDEMIKAAQEGKWQTVEPPAIQATYNPQNGVWKRGDWNFVVVSNDPITAKAFKGKSESGLLSSHTKAKVPVAVAAPIATQVAQSVSPVFAGFGTPQVTPVQPAPPQPAQSNPANNPVFNTPSTPLSQSTVTPAQAASQSPTAPAQPTPSGAASAGQLLGTMSPTTLGLLALGAVVVVGILIYMANK